VHSHQSGLSVLSQSWKRTCGPALLGVASPDAMDLAAQLAPR
jgi:hypothetical protein